MGQFHNSSVGCFSPKRSLFIKYITAGIQHYRQLQIHRKLSSGHTRKINHVLKRNSKKSKVSDKMKPLLPFMSNSIEQAYFFGIHIRDLQGERGRDNRDMQVILGSYYLFSQCGSSLSQQSITK